MNMEEPALTGLEPEAEEMLRMFPKNPVVCADIHSIAISLKRAADAQGGRVPALLARDAAIERLREALKDLVEIIDAAGLHNLARGVELGSTSWFVKATDRLNYAKTFLQAEQREAALP